MTVDSDIQSIINKYNSLNLVSKLKKIKKSSTVVQTVILSKSKFKTKSKAISWMKDNDFNSSKLFETDNKWRFRQKDPKLFKDGTFKTEKIDTEVTIISAIPKIEKTSKFIAEVKIKNISKFSKLPTDIKSDLDIPIPMDTEIWILSEGENRDGIILHPDLLDSLHLWEGVDIIPFHNMDNMDDITQYNITDNCGNVDNATIKEKDGKRWTVVNARITNRNVAYQMYLREKQGKKIEASAEYRWTRDYTNDGRVLQTNIKPGVISFVDKGHIKGNEVNIVSSI